MLNSSGRVQDGKKASSWVHCGSCIASLLLHLSVEASDTPSRTVADENQLLKQKPTSQNEQRTRGVPPLQVRSTPCGARCGSACTPSTWSAGCCGSPGLRSIWSVARGSSPIRRESWARSRISWACRGSSPTSISTSTRPRASPAWRSRRAAANRTAWARQRDGLTHTLTQRWCRGWGTFTGPITSASIRWLARTLDGSKHLHCLFSKWKNVFLKDKWRDWLKKTK